MPPARDFDAELRALTLEVARLLAVVLHDQELYLTHMAQLSDMVSEIVAGMQLHQRTPAEFAHDGSERARAPWQQ